MIRKLQLIIAACILLMSAQSVDAQITIGNSDMAVAGDTFRVSIANFAPVGTDLSITGANTTWDYSALQYTSQDVDTFLATSATATFYALYFLNSPLNSNRASVASRGPDLSAAGGAVPVSDVFNFYYASSSLYQQVGFGANISGVTTPIAYSNKDKIYNFPVSFGDADSCDSNYSLSVPGIGYVEGQQHRVNNVDGWGSLTTPFGTFNTIRVVSELTGQDSLYLDTLGFGFSFPRNKTREYKWLATNSGIPELQINTTVLGGSEIISSIRYRDIYRDTTTSVGLNNNLAAEFTANLYPNPSLDGNCMLQVKNANSNKLKVQVYSITGALLLNLDKSLDNNSSNIIQLSELNALAAGMYRISVVAGNNSTQLSWIKK
ncbi:MAG TPA: T9SS type A sorting domain-containing protein [Bacteroidia bacterium]|nr:T9SS type A sorting domain-containing protein [Bacteroidia bacterium]